MDFFCDEPELPVDVFTTWLCEVIRHSFLPPRMLSKTILPIGFNRPLKSSDGAFHVILKISNAGEYRIRELFKCRDPKVSTISAKKKLKEVLFSSCRTDMIHHVIY